MIVGMTTVMPAPGIRVFIVAGQVLMAVIASHIGVLGVPGDQISIGKLAGVLLILAGAFFSVCG